MSRKGKKLRGEQNIIISSPTVLFPKLQAQPQAAGEAWTCHIHVPPEARPLHRGTCAQQRQSTAHKEQHRPRSHCHNATAWHCHAQQRMSVCWGSPWAKASAAVTAPYMSPGPFPEPSPPLPVQAGHSLGQQFFPLHQAQPSQALTPKAAVIQSAF